MDVKKRVEIRKDIVERLKKLVIERLRLNLSPNEISEDAPLFGLGLGIDSVDVLEIVVGIEQEFGISVNEEDMHIFRSINTLADFVIERKGGNN